MKILSDAGADFQLKDASGNTPAEVAEKCKESEIAEFLQVVQFLYLSGTLTSILH